ncbi:phasin family protein [Microvirga splendida]|uniref:Phasin family protein n=1 Tax=Microvirga splendida TaxID=2795727 RepID=A0ABS0XYH8_9HYPH|nr:phasin family protein [Microvirga splendida]MBJ6125112.1 phasin family protein [Microvirga splendida]
MLQPFAQFQKLGQDNLDATMKAIGAFSSNSQAIATEAADFARKSFEHTSSTVEKLLGVQTLDKAVEIQTAYVKGAYDNLVSQSTKLGSLYSSLATETLKPYEGLLSKAS